MSEQPSHFGEHLIFARSPYSRLHEVGTIVTPPPPMALHVSDGQSHTMLVSNEHTTYSAHPQYRLMDQSWHEMMCLTGGAGFDNLVEGKSLGHSVSPNTSIQWFGARGWHAYMSAKYGIPIDSGDTPNYNESAELLRDGFHPRHVLFYYMYRHIPQYLMQGCEGERSWDEYATYWLEVYKNALSATDFPGINDAIGAFYEHDMWQLHQELLGLHYKISFNDPYLPLEQTTSYWQIDTQVQKIALACAIRRFDHLISLIQRRSQAGRNTFTAWGWQHVYAMLQTGALDQLGDVRVIKLDDPEFPLTSHISNSFPHADSLRY